MVLYIVNMQKSVYKGLWVLGIAWALLSCSKPQEKIIAVFDNGSPKAALLVDANSEIVGRRTWHGNGVIATETQWRAGFPHGKFRRWTSNGEVSEEGTFRQGAPQGEWTTWYSRGKLASRGRYLDGHKEGRWEGFDPNGSLLWEQMYNGGNAIGLWRSYYPDGAVQEESTCHIGVAAGHTQRWAANGQLLLYRECRQGIPHGLWMDYYAGGSLRWVGRYTGGLPDSTWQLYRANGALWKTENWSKGLRHGLWAWYGKELDTLALAIFVQGSGAFGEPCPLSHPYVQQRVCAETTWVNGRIHGRAFSYTENQALLRSEVWTNGAKDSTFFYRPDSLGHPAHLVSAGTWKNGLRDGIWRSWYNNGRLKDSLHYRAGEFYGDQLHYDTLGRLYMKKSTRGKNYPVIIETLDAKTQKTSAKASAKVNTKVNVK